MKSTILILAISLVGGTGFARNACPVNLDLAHMYSKEQVASLEVVNFVASKGGDGSIEAAAYDCEGVQLAPIYAISAEGFELNEILGKGYLLKDVLSKNPQVYDTCQGPQGSAVYFVKGSLRIR